MAETGAPESGTIIAGKYRVLSVLGSGGMSCLVKADHLLMKKQVAIKFLRSDKVGAKRRLYREARAAQALSSEHVVRVFDLGEHDGAAYIVMELLDGADLAASVSASGRLSAEAAVDAVLEACVAVAEAHAQGIFHRDLKPANLFISRTKTQEIIKVLDFGISKVEAEESEDCEKTSSDAMLGTPYYMSPEQLRNPSNVDGRTDVWALGVTLYFLLSREHPFPGANRREVMAAVLTDPPRDLRALVPGLSPELVGVIERALAKRADDRIATIHALAKALVPFASKRGERAVDRIGAIEGPPLPPAPESASKLNETRDKLATTDDGVSSTLPPTEEDAHPAKEPPPPPRRRSLVLPSTIAIALLTIIAISWQTTRTTATATPASSARAIESAPSAAVAVPEVPPPSASTTALVIAEPPPPEPKLVPKAPGAAKPRPAATASVAPKASASPPRVDIDGVPIVE